MRFLRLLASVSLLGGCFAVLSTTPASAAEPSVTVSPSTGLVHGESVVVRVRGLPPHLTADLAECDQPFYPNFNCWPYVVGTVTTNASGRGASAVELIDHTVGGDPYHAHAVYCRADVCRMWVYWQGKSGTFHKVSSAPMEFTGSPATIQADATDVVPGQRVKVAGAAYGAEGETVAVYEGVCGTYHETFCKYDLRGSTTVRPNGTWSTAVRVRRHLSFGPCVPPPEPYDGGCLLEARVIDASGNVDIGFANPDIGDAGWPISFTAA
ncbi:MAG: neocarzinostatin apoprotein domain-containing protein [Actinomycetes bacterium]